jgi:hypothetical protein
VMWVTVSASGKRWSKCAWPRAKAALCPGS